MDALLNNLGWIIFIGFIILSVIFNSVGEKLKKASEAADRSRDYQKSPHKFNPLGGESAEDFFARMKTEQQKESKKLRLKPKHQIREENLPSEHLRQAYEPVQEQVYEPEIEVPKVSSKSNKPKQKVDITDKKSLRKAIIINEVLSHPKAYEF